MQVLVETKENQFGKPTDLQPGAYTDIEKLLLLHEMKIIYVSIVLSKIISV